MYDLEVLAGGREKELAVKVLGAWPQGASKVVIELAGHAGALSWASTTSVHPCNAAGSSNDIKDT